MHESAGNEDKELRIRDNACPDGLRLKHGCPAGPADLHDLAGNEGEEPRIRREAEMPWRACGPAARCPR